MLFVYLPYRRHSSNKVLSYLIRTQKQTHLPNTQKVGQNSENTLICKATKLLLFYKKMEDY